MRGRIWLGVAILALLLAGCGEDEEASVANAKIVEALDLKKSEGGFAIDGDPFCEVSIKLLNDSGEIEHAADEDKLGLVISSAGGNAGIEGVAPFAPDCKDVAKKKLNRLDPRPKEDE